MAKKSKTQKAKAAAKRKQRKLASEQPIENEVKEAAEVIKEEEQGKKNIAKKVFKKNETAQDSGSSKKADAKPKKRNKFVQFLIDVKAELKRVTWPSREDVIRWSGVVVASLIFFGCYVAFFDNLVITPLLLWISGLGG